MNRLISFDIFAAVILKTGLVLALLCLPLLLAAQLKTFVITPTAAPTQYELNISHPECGQLIVLTSLKNLFFVSNMEGIKAVDYRPLESKYVIFLKPVRQKVELKAEGFIQADLWGPGTPKARETYYYTVEARHGTLGKGDLLLQSDPPGAEVRLEGFPDFRALTPFNFEQYGATTYNIVLSKERYETQKIVLNIESGRALTRSIRLKPLWADLAVNSEPSGSRVLIDGKVVGHTPLELSGLEKGLDPGSYEVVVEPGSEFNDVIRRSIVLTADGREELNLIHEDSSGYIQINASPQPIQVYLDGRRDDQLSQKLSKRMLAGRYKIKAEYTGDRSFAYDPLELEVDLKAGAELNQAFNFVPRQANLLLSSNIDNPRIILRDLHSGNTTEYYDLSQVPTLLAGRYDLRVEKTGYRVFRQEIQVDQRDIILELNLEKLDQIYSQRIRSARTRKYIAASTFTALMGSTAYFALDSQLNYEKYKKSSSSSEARELKDKSQKSVELAYVAGGVDIVAGSWWLYSWLRQRQWSKKLRLEMEVGRK